MRTATHYTSIREQVEFGLETIEAGRTIIAPLRSIVFALKSLRELEALFRPSRRLGSHDELLNFLLASNGAYDLIHCAYYDHLCRILPKDIEEAFDGDRFENPAPPLYFEASESDFKMLDGERPRGEAESASLKTRAERAIESIAADQTVEVSLRSLMFVFMVFEELNSFFHQPLHYPDLESALRFLVGPDGAYRLMREALDVHIQSMLPSEVLEAVDPDGPVSPRNTLSVPDDQALHRFFRSSPTAREHSSRWYRAFRYEDDSGVSVRLAFDIAECSVQTELRLGERVLERVCSEGGRSLRIDESDVAPSLRATFEHDGVRSELRVRLHPVISLDWTTLRV